MCRRNNGVARGLYTGDAECLLVRSCRGGWAIAPLPICPVSRAHSEHALRSPSIVRVERTPRAAAARRRGGGASANCKNAGAGTKSDQNPRRDDGDANTIIGTRRPQDAMTQWTQPVAPVVANADRRRVPLALDNTHHTIHTLLFTSHDHLPHQ